MLVRWLTTLAVPLSLAAGLGLTQDPPKSSSRSLIGELVRVDLQRRSLTLKTTGKEPREYELAVDEATRFVSQGRALSFEQLRIGESAIAVVVEDARGGRRLRLLKLGPSDYAAPSGPRSKPSPSS